MSFAGPWTSGQRLYCHTFDGWTVCDTLPQYISLSMRLTAASLDTCALAARRSVVAVSDDDVPFAPACAADSVDLNPLLDQEITVELTCVPGDWPVEDLIGACSGTLSSVGADGAGAGRDGLALRMLWWR